MPTIQTYKGAEVYIPSSSNPKYGVGPEGVNTAAEIDTYLTSSMPSQDAGQVSFTANAGEFFYFMSPKALGSAKFIDDASGLPGAMDGATWPNGEIGITTGPLVVSYQGEQWYLYRSDFAELGSATFNVSYTDPIAPAKYPVSVLIAGPSSADESSSGALTATVTYNDASTKIISDGEGTWVSDDADLVFADETIGDFTTEVITASKTATVTYTYIEQGETVQDTHQILITDVSATPVSSKILGPATLDAGASHTYQLEVTYDDASKVIVSATWSATGSDLTINSTTGEATAGSPASQIVSTVTALKTIDAVNLDATLDVTVNEAPAVSLVPIFGVGDFGYNQASAAQLDTLSDVADENNIQITIDAGTDEFIYYAAPVSKGPATITDAASGFPGGWDGATWESDFDIKTGPLEVTYRGVQWNVYRTDWKNITTNFNISH